MRSLQDIRRELDDLKKSLENDVYPIIQRYNTQGGYFGVPRAVLSYVDYLGALYRGYNGEMNRGNRAIATTPKAERFIQDIMGAVDPNYAVNGRLLYKMYRHGTIHLYRPNTLRNMTTGETLLWVAYKGNRMDNITHDGRLIVVEHVVPQYGSDTEYLFPVAINCLYDDLQAAIDHYYQMIEDEVNSGVTTLQENYSNTKDALDLPEEVNLTWNT